jgi:hypothetical protein|tara:strand:- start:1412 stop:1672 length:261 start_codon:yes stop_codon:yes gene_type:complete
MNYYIVTTEIFDTLDKENISFMRKSIDDTTRLIVTTDTVTNRVRKFNNINTCSSYTFTNHTDWVGDSTGVEVEELEDGGYISIIDD